MHCYTEEWFPLSCSQAGLFLSSPFIQTTVPALARPQEYACVFQQQPLCLLGDCWLRKHPSRWKLSIRLLWGIQADVFQKLPGGAGIVALADVGGCFLKQVASSDYNLLTLMQRLLKNRGQLGCTWHLTANPYFPGMGEELVICVWLTFTQCAIHFLWEHRYF